MNDKILVLDFGSQYNQLIVRRIRELGVYSELVPHDISLDKIKQDPSIKGLILSGGPHSVYDQDSFTVPKQLFELDIPILGICYGMQLMAHLLGGYVEGSQHHEFGKTYIDLIDENPLTAGLGKTTSVWMSHGDQVKVLPPFFVCTAKSSATEHVMMRHLARRLFGIQFHPEVTHTEQGLYMLEQFVKLTEASRTWSMTTFIESQVEKIQNTVLDQQVILGLSGGVDSSVAAALLDKAIGKQLTCIFVDHGLLRKNEGQEVADYFNQNFQLNLVVVDAKGLFLEKLKGVENPEDKRKIIGKTFIDVFEAETKKLKNATFLAQGTLYTDLIESGTKHAKTIKSHHNVGGLPKEMNLKLIEPLNTLFKDEVRKLGQALGLPEALVQRQPFPGPGLAIRIIGDVTEEKLKIVANSDQILRDEFLTHGLNQSVWQYFTVLTPIKTVGVKGDNRSYEYVLAIRAVTSIDGMTADFAHIPYDVLSKVSSRITNEIKGVGRVVYDITSKPPGTIEWE
ncbi:glutamine-hydrolyzing GMP synthase [Acholeplasma manati]|uniref:GMP synthase [glutamine-hydrolyzing] n=1 Tax=Paracholeplasma manati TaxID=591373 RepID=A0ABT2Y3A3_9MOLU|nr:glutamine-hydrolyzing GMP synthase [Paracholeplasma manati]MCV2231209.1 glutamine-hydrolyzing GMP synthase [Paracholeplasma manati]